MKIAWLDLETGGLNPDVDQIYEIGCIVDDLAKPEVPLADLPQIQIYVKHLRYELDPFNFSALVRRMPMITDVGMLPNTAYSTFIDFLAKHASEEGKVTFGGKNVASFDWQFLKRHFNNFAKTFKVGHRMLDIGSLCALPTDPVIPDLAQCCKRYGVPVIDAHEALPDAIMCARVARACYAERVAGIIPT